MDRFTAGFVDYAAYELRNSPATVQAYADRFRMAERYFRKKWWEVTSDDLRALKRTDRYSTQTVAGIITAIRQGHEWGAQEGHWPLNGIGKVRVPKVVNDTPPPVPLGIANLLLEYCTKPLEYRLVYLGLFAGTRISETAKIGAEHWDDGVLRFTGAKNRKVREIPVHEELEKVKAAILCSPPTVPQNIQRAKKQMGERLGVEFHTHQLRSRFATSLSEAGAPWEVVASLLGHNLGITGRYAVISLKRKRDAIEALAYGRTPDSKEPPSE